MKKDDTCPEGHKYRTINPDHESVNFKYCYNLPACAKNNKCWELQHKSGSGKCAYKVSKKEDKSKTAERKYKKLDNKFPFNKKGNVEIFTDGADVILENGKKIKYFGFEGNCKNLCNRNSDCDGIMFNTSTKVCTSLMDMYKDGSMYELRTLPYASRPANIFVKEKAAKSVIAVNLDIKEILKFM